MSRRHLRRTGPGPLELIEEAVHLLRLAPWGVLGSYYLGSLPFVLGLLYFWTDMSRGWAAYKHCAPAAFAVSLLFLWMKTWQALFARQLKEQIAGRSASSVVFAGFFRTAINQTILQPSGLFLLPLSLLLVLPFGWVYAFYQSVNAFAAEDGAAPKHVFQRASRQAQLWPRQNHTVLGVSLILGVVVFLDVAMGLATVPSLLKMLFGIENAFTRSSWGLLNSTFMATVGALTYLSLDPLVKAVYLLRCFYGESQHTGEDLRAELKQFVQGAGVAAMVLLPVVLSLAAMDDRSADFQSAVSPNCIRQSVGPVLGVGPLRRDADYKSAIQQSATLRYTEAQRKCPVDKFLAFRFRRFVAGAGQVPSGIPNAEAQTPNSEISLPDLDRSIDEVLGRREFNWRLPRERQAEDNSQKGVFAGFMDGLISTMRSWAKAIGSGIKAVGRWVGDAIDWLREKILGKNAKAPQEGRADWMVSLQGLIFVLLVLAACAVAILFYRTWRRRTSRREIESESVAPVPDVADDNVSANQLPEDDWLRLARELMGNGELRLALRAFYLASLAHLAQREMIRVARFKSNRDYEHELRRRARALPELQAAFSENVGIFDHAWYGLHDVTHEALQRFQNNLEKIKAS